MITIDQLLESVDLDFEPRFVTKSRNGYVEIWSDEPTVGATTWYHSSDDTIYQSICRLKLADFENKDWQECIYEVPRKTTGKIEKIPDELNLQTGEYGNTKFDIIPKETFAMACRKINELVVAVNELRGDKHPISNPQAKGAKNE